MKMHPIRVDSNGRFNKPAHSTKNEKNLRNAPKTIGRKPNHDKSV